MTVNEPFEFFFNGEKEIEHSLWKFSKLNYMTTLFILASISLLSVKNQKGIDIGELCHFLSETSESYQPMEMHVFVGQLIQAGFLHGDKSLDRDGDASMLIRLASKEIGEHSTTLFKKGFPKVSAGIDELKTFDFNVAYKKDSEMKTSDTKH